MRRAARIRGRHSAAVRRPRISFVVARADNGVIGRDNALPWQLPDDLRHFKRLTLGKPIVMGRRTWESLGGPLPGRRSIVLTRDAAYQAEGAAVVDSLDTAIAAAGDAPEVAVIGGAAVFAAALPLATVVYLTEVHASPDGDIVMPPFGPEWHETARQAHPADGSRPAFSFVTLERR